MNARLTWLLAVALSLTLSAPTLAASSVHGRIVAVDREKGTVTIKHDPFKAMPMSMEMIATLKDRAALAKLHAGDAFDAQIDTEASPWRILSIHGYKPKR